jgi:two-component system cell cycle sensor histidine kinase/response regulator CckA
MNTAPDVPRSANPHWVLIVDDEESMCQMIREMLAEEPVEVVAASDGAAALRLVEERVREPLLVLTDVLMPGIDGLTLARKLAARIRRGKIVVMSGHLSDVSWWPADLRELAFIAKPFRLADLTRFLREARLQYENAP